MNRCKTSCKEFLIILFISGCFLSSSVKTAAQNVGIGIAAPTRKLHVNYGSIRFEGPLYPFGDTVVLSIGGYGDVQVDTFGTSGGRFIIKENGNVGIGVINPQQRFSVKYGMNIDQANANNGSIDNNVLRFGDNSGEAIGSGRRAGSNNQYGLDFYTASAKRMVISNLGNVGIGVTNPTASLEVTRGDGINGTAMFRGSQYFSHFNYSDNEDTYIRAGKDNGNVIINDMTGGKVGVGTNNPLEKLDVSGNIRASSYKYSTPKTYYYSISPVAFSSEVSSSKVIKFDESVYFDIGASGFLVAPVFLPHGATITSFTVYYDDNSATQDLVVTLLRRDFNSPGVLVSATVSSTGSAGLGSGVDNAIVLPTVNNQGNSLLIEAYSYPSISNWPAAALRLRGLIISYTINEVQ